ncbi:hypothetical protein SAMN04488498_11128 [Mesorhizobium albiziae]|uniref:Uncharacterized protein n=1 Tax=Neomesorhizobium albiziae TaxID=335020 RepID=A0A1I4BS95_9HYPH|nr:hypothetical protein [Mesorhizobium albiziae]SFK71280.1 hypothetical protein SAMN04488498_11128 [Mesorhizobium albiziae]
MPERCPPRSGRRLRGQRQVDPGAARLEAARGSKIRDALARHGPDVPVFILDSRSGAGTLLALLERRDTD